MFANEFSVSTKFLIFSTWN